MVGQPSYMKLPDVVGFRLKGRLRPGVNATDLVLTCVQMLRKKGVVGKFVEFCGPGYAGLELADRATLANMAPEYGATMGYCPIDGNTIEYLRLTGRDSAHIDAVEKYAKEQTLWYDGEAEYTDMLELDLEYGRTVARRAQEAPGPHPSFRDERSLRKIPQGPGS